MSKIEILVKSGNKVESSSSQLSPESTTAQEVSEKLDAKNNIADRNKKGAQGMAIASVVASRTLSHTTSNIGKWTGNSRNQDTVNNIMQIGGIAAAAYINPWLALAVAAIQIGTTAADAAWTNNQEAIKSNVRKLRAGYTSDDQIIGGRK